MKFDLPSASSVHRTRAIKPLPEKKRKPFFRALFALALFVGAATLGFAYLLDTLAQPRIDLIDPPVGEPGGIVAIRGRNFGQERGESRIEIDGVAPTSSSYLAWSDAEISVRLPIAVDSGIVHVKTRHGSSNPKLYMNRARLPVNATGDRAGRSGPYLASLSAESGPIGSLLIVSGLDFGANREASSLSFSWNAESASSASIDLSLPTSVSPSELDLGYELWSDKEIRARVPDGAVSGAIYVTTAKGRSNGAFFRIVDAPGVKRFFERRSYALSQTISITKLRASGPNELYLWAPRPSESASQRVAKVLGQEPPPILPDYRGASLFRFKDLAAEKDAAVSQSFLVQVYAVETEVDPSRIVAKPSNPGAAMTAYLAADAWVPSDAREVIETARKIAGGERNPWRLARLVWNWMLKNVAWDPGSEPGKEPKSEPAKVQEAIAAKKADSYAYALLGCALLRASGVPAIPVAGYLVDASRATARHYWIEVYIYGLGWLPLDPVLGSGAGPGGIGVAWEDRARYFGGIDNRHIAFSRGVKILAPMSPQGRRVSKERRWSFQSFYEEASGALEAYSSYWGDVEVTGMY